MDKTSNIDTIATSKSGLVTDLNSSYLGKDQYSYARNAVRNTKEGDLGTISNEPSTVQCYSAPYKILGIIPLPDGKDMVFSGDESNSEIGIGDPKKCTYKTVKNLATLNFSQFNQPITGVAKKDFNKGIVVTFTDKANPVRRVELNKLARLTNVDDILLFKKINRPTISLQRGKIGNMPNGTYSVAVAYSVDNKVFTDWYSVSNRIQLYSESGNNALEIKIGNLDNDFTDFSLLVVGNYVDPDTGGATKAAKIVGTYSTKVRSVSVTDFINSKYETVDLNTLLIKKTTWQKAGIISSNSNYLLLGDLVAREEENYQLKAFSIKTEYVVEQVLADYYDQDGRDVGYYRDENYDFYIQGVYVTGELTDKFHIAGREKKADDKTIVASDDVYEYDLGCEEERKIEKWEVKNTAGPIHYLNEEFKCNRRTLGYGEMGYFENTELYPDNVPVYGANANKPQRFHKMPDECIVPRYEKIENKTYINILGVRFKNIPKFDDPDITGYIITRSDRKGGNGTVIARGLMTNVRTYTDPQLNTEVMFSNYTVNDLNPDVYLSSTQTTFSNNREHRFTPLSLYYKDRFNFYSPHTMFEPKYTLGGEIKIEAEEIADVTGQFEVVYNHPKQKLLNQFAFWASLAIGYIETYYESQGLKNSVKASTSGGLSGQAFISAGQTTGPINFDQDGPGPGGVKSSAETTVLGSGSALAISGQGVQDALSSLGSIIKSGNFGQLKTYIKTLKNVIKLIVSLGVKVVLTAVSIMRYANEVLDIIYGFTGYTDYVYQYNAYAKFNQSKCVGKRRGLVRPALYIPSDIVSIDDALYNNYFREPTVYLELNKEIDDPSTKDNTRNTISGFGICDNINRKVSSRGVAFYATSKAANPNQYGRIGSSSPVAIHSDVITDFAITPTLWGGDCIITRFQFQKKMQFFNQNIANTNYQNGVEYDYRMYRNIAYPRFWIDSSKYDFSNLLNKKVVNFSTFSRTTAGKHNLDCKKSNDGGSIARIDNAYMYTSNNAVLDFFVEADYNPNFRKKDFHTNVSQIFRSDRLEKPEVFEINRAFSDIYTTELYAPQQRDDFDPENPIPVNQENSVIYSLPSFNLQYADNWQYFLPANFFAFSQTDFGKLTTIQKIDQDRLIFLFSKSSPFVSMGRDFLQLEGSGRKVTIGDGGLFAQDPREIMPTDNNYGSSNSRFAFSNTHLGRYYPSANQGRFMQFTEGLDDITRQGISYWCKNYMPIRLYDYFPDYPETENPISGVGYQCVFDSFNETVYIIKRDFSPRYTDITYEDGGFIYKGNEISLRDSRYFNDISWTLSYSPLEKAFTSWHDWHPDLVVQRENHFHTVKDKTVWKHNETTDSFCVFYGTQHPFEIEFLSSAGQTVEAVRSIEYLLEVYKYKNFGRNRFHVLNENFDGLIVSNTEQMSPLLNLVYGGEDPELHQDYPKINTSNAVSWDVLFAKEENKYRVNQFWDATRDRGEFTNADNHLWSTDESGYRSVINSVAIDVNKPEEQRKKFRHYFNKFRLIKKASEDKKFIVKLLNVKKLLSPR